MVWRGLAWIAIIAAFNLVLGLGFAAVGAIFEDWALLMFGGVQATTGVGFAMLSLRE